MAKYCGKHDKCYSEGEDCFGCVTEAKQQAEQQAAEAKQQAEPEQN